MTIHPFTTRAHVLGLPMGPRGLDWSSIVASAFALASVVGTVEASVAVKHRVDLMKRRWADRLQEGKELLDEGEELLNHASGIAHTVSGVSHAVSKAGGAAGRRQ